MSLNDNKGRRHASIYLGDPPVSYGGGDRHSGDRGLCLVARRGIRRCPEMAEIAPSAQGPQGAIAQACQRARPVVANGALRGPSPGQARFDSVMRASAAHDRRPRGRPMHRRRPHAQLAALRIERHSAKSVDEPLHVKSASLSPAGRTRSRIAQVSSSLSRRSERRGCSACPTAIVPSASSQGSLPAQSPGISSPTEAGPNDGAEQTIAMRRRSTIRPCTSRDHARSDICTLATSPFCFGFGHTGRQSTWSVHRNISES